MKENKTQPTKHLVDAYLAAIKDEERRADATRLVALMKKATGEDPVMWGAAIIGFGLRHYVYESGREGDTVKVGFAPRKQNFAIYGLSESAKNATLMSQLGKHSTGKGCLYIKSLADVDPKVLSQMIRNGFQFYSSK